MTDPKFVPLVNHDAATTIDERPMIVSSWEGRIVDDRYRVLEKIGEGGMGAVYVAEHLTLHKQVAFKTILPQYARDGDVSARFEREAMATGRLEHPHVASAMDFGTLPDGGAYLVMQLVRGRSVEEILLSEGAMSWPRVCAVASQVADALSAAHHAGIVHRDLKPENVMLEERDDGSELALVLDFGIAQIQGETELGGKTSSGPQTRAITRLGAVVGTPGYMAPEQALGEKTDHRTDLYSLGVLLWEMLTGRTLFDSDDVTEIVTEQISGVPTKRIAEMTNDDSVPAELQDLIDNLLARKPAKRPESAAYAREVLHDITMQAATSGDKRVSRSRLTPVSNARVEHPSPTPVVDSLKPVSRKGTWIAIAIGTLAIVGTVSAAAFFLRTEAVAEDSATDPELIQAIYEEARQANRVEELERQQDIMLHNEDTDVRHQAALFVLDFEPADAVETYVRGIAEIETAQGCAEFRSALTHLLESPDPRARPTVERMEGADRCRRRGRRIHCYACVRNQIREFLDATAPDEVLDPPGE